MNTRTKLGSAGLAVVCAALVGVGCGGGDDNGGGNSASNGNGAAGETTTDGGSASGPVVQIKTFDFQPDPIEISAGETVTFENLDETTHTVTSGPRDKPDGEYDASLAGSGSTFEQTYDEPGTYDYVCTIHPGPGMEGQVIVK